MLFYTLFTQFVECTSTDCKIKRDHRKKNIAKNKNIMQIRHTKVNTNFFNNLLFTQKIRPGIKSIYPPG
jgi:hypothetical protein